MTLIRFQIEIHTTNPFVSIDAVELQSPRLQSVCQQCPKLQYRVYRNPPFHAGPYLDLPSRSLTDGDLKPNQIYTYNVAVVNDSSVGEPSPPLQYQFNQPFCGDGIIQSNMGEFCDDGIKIGFFHSDYRLVAPSLRC